MPDNVANKVNAGVCELLLKGEAVGGEEGGLAMDCREEAKPGTGETIRTTQVRKKH